MPSTKDIAVIGGGLMGMAVARKLASAGCRVTVLESAEQIGGLSTWQEFNDFVWDRFYHVILPSDRHLIALLHELGMQDELEWNRTRTGFFVDGKIHSISSNVEFLRFPPLSLLSKVRLAFTLLYGSRLNDWRSLEQETCESWLRRVSGSSNYEKLWKPLLLAKLGESHTRVSAVFIWSYIKRMFSARDKSASAEQLGQVRGGYRSVFEGMQRDIVAKGGEIFANTRVARIKDAGQGRLQVTTDESERVFDSVICTSPVSVLQKIAAPELLDVRATGADIEYLGVVCVVIVSKTNISPFYVVNIADATIPFTGVIGMSTVVSPKNTGDYFLTYLPRYALASDPVFQMDDDTCKNSFLKGLENMFPAFDQNEIIDVRIHRAKRVQPLQVLGYSTLVPDVQTKHKNFYTLNTSQFVNSTLNNNEVIAAANHFCDTHQGSICGADSGVSP